MEIFKNLHAHHLLKKSNLTKQEIHTIHKDIIFLGKNRNKITYKILEYLPTIQKHKIYEQYQCATIEEYAGRYAGLSKSVVQKRLRLERHVQNKPELKKVIGEQGVHKVSLVARLTTNENEKQVANLVRNMSKEALATWAKEKRTGKIPGLKIELNQEMEFLFFKLKNKLGKNMSNKTAMREILRKMAEQEFSKENKSPKASRIFPGTKSKSKPTHYIPVAQKREALAKTQGQCAHPNCHKPAETFHHKIPFSISKNHESIIPLCKIHHEFAHNTKQTHTNLLYQKYRQEALL